jgi:D-alanine--poly(phosphoribitol) ligase subunit 1
MNILERIDNWGRAAPNRLAHVSGGRTLTYGELLERSDALGAQLVQSLPDDGSPVVVLGHKEPEMLIAFLGAVKAGHPYVPVDNALPPQRVERIVATAGARLTLTPASVVELSARGGSPAKRRLAPEDPYYILFTSGTTGEPKGVVITYGCVANFLEWVLKHQDFQEQKETFLNQVLYSFDVSVMDSYLALLNGGTVWSITRDDIGDLKPLFKSLAASGVTIWVSTPSFAAMCLVERSFRASMLPRLRRFFVAGEVLAPELVAQLLDRFPGTEVWNAYGPTEATVIVTWVNVDRDLLGRNSPLPIGHPMAGNRILILDEGGRPVAPGERGEIVIAGPSVSPGYLGRPDLTARSFFEHDGLRAYHTGDWGRVRDGLVFYEGRRDTQVKLHGYRVELGDVETHLRALPGLLDAAVLPVMKGGRPESLAAFVTLAERPAGSDFELSLMLRSRLAERLPAYMIPHRFRFLEIFPMNANGKVDRRALADLLT